MSRFDFVVVNVDTAVPLAERRAYAAAQQIQVREHIAPAWQLDCTMNVRAATPDALPLAGEVEIRLMKTPTMDGALGYHDQKDDGTPICYVFVGLAEKYGDEWTSVASHEVAEILGDPRLRLCVQRSDGFWDREIADRVEGDSYSIAVDDAHVWVSNFNYPEAFEEPKTLSIHTQYDHMDLTTKPNEIRPNGGYAQRFDPKKGWEQLGQMSAYRAHLAKLGLGRVARRAARPQPKRPSWLSRFARSLFPS